jgi:hypothetical protein
MDDALSLRRLDRLIWTMVAAVGAVVLAAVAAGEFQIAWRTFAPPAVACTLLIAASWFYRFWRSDPRLASGLSSTAQVIAFAAVGAPLSYLAASPNLPLQDHAFDLVDRAVGVDWPALLAWMDAQSTTHFVLALSYLSFAAQAVITLLALTFSNRLLHLKTFTLAFMLSALVCIAVSAVLPAEGVWDYYRFDPADYPSIVPATRAASPIFHGLRDGSLRLFVGAGSEGIITFPSFHAALGIVFIAGLWPVPVLRWVALIWNVLMILATPVDGGHYVADVLAGVPIAVLCQIAAYRIVQAARRMPRAGIAVPALSQASGIERRMAG